MQLKDILKAMLLLLTMMLICPGYGVIQVDQSQRECPGDTDWNGGMQTFTAGMNGMLTGIALHLREMGITQVGSDIHLTLLATDEHTNPSNDKILAEGTWACSGNGEQAGWVSIYFDQPYPQKYGELLAFRIEETSGGVNNGYNHYSYSDLDPYPYGKFYWQNKAQEDYDLAFETLVDADEGLFLMAPNEGRYVKSGDVVDIRWESAGRVTRVNLYYSLDGGGQWTLLVKQTLNDGYHAWKTGLTLEAEACLIKIENSFQTSMFDTSDRPFQIYPCSAGLTADLSGDCFVDLEDFQIFCQQWLTDGEI